MGRKNILFFVLLLIKCNGIAYSGSLSRAFGNDVNLVGPKNACSIDYEQHMDRNELDALENL